MVLMFLAVTSFKNFNIFFDKFEDLSRVTEENIAFLEIERDIIELQRNTLVYSYIGYRGVLKKIEHIEKSLDNRFETIRPITVRHPEIQESFLRMFDHYQTYKDGFSEAIKERAQIQDIRAEKLTPMEKQGHAALDAIIAASKNSGLYKAAFKASEIKHILSKVGENMRSFETYPDSVLIKETNTLIEHMKQKTDQLQVILPDAANKKKLTVFCESLNTYQENAASIIKISRVYLHLINVVLAGKAAEISTLSKELYRHVDQRSNTLKLGIQNDIEIVQAGYIIYAFLAGILGIVFALMIAISIARPVKNITQTLSKLARGEDAPIPGRNRGDEVGEMAQAAEEFKNVLQRLEHQTQELEEFAYRTSHDLRSPLVSSIGLLEIAETAIRAKDDAQAMEVITMANSSLKKLEILVKDILELTRTKNMEEQPQSVHIEDVIDAALEKLKHMEYFTRLKIQKECAFTLPITVKKTRLIVIIENMISNAVKYQDLNKEHSYMTLRTYEEDNKCIVEIQDNGLGIPENQQSKLFTMFKRFHPRTAYGSGLGLYMMKKSVDILGGKITFTDTGDGALFKVHIPIN